MSKKNITKDILIKLYIQERMKIITIAKMLNCDDTVIYDYLHKYNIKSNRRLGKYKLPSGYILVRVKNHPYATKAGYVREHRLVMEKKLNRYLLPTEFVDYINEVKWDNRPENLRLVTIGENVKYYMDNHGNPFKGKKHSEETKAIIREKRKKQVGIYHPFYGKHHSDETKRKISLTKRGIAYE